ncbi:hypothetical protein ACEPPN_005571 [Leptodophora sp. 'Broadleaf-Isolate-01']
MSGSRKPPDPLKKDPILFLPPHPSEQSENAGSGSPLGPSDIQTVIKSELEELDMLYLEIGNLHPESSKRDSSSSYVFDSPQLNAIAVVISHSLVEKRPLAFFYLLSNPCLVFQSSAYDPLDPEHSIQLFRVIHRVCVAEDPLARNSYPGIVLPSKQPYHFSPLLTCKGLPLLLPIPDSNGYDVRTGTVVAWQEEVVYRVDVVCSVVANGILNDRPQYWFANGVKKLDCLLAQVIHTAGFEYIQQNEPTFAGDGGLSTLAELLRIAPVVAPVVQHAQIKKQNARTLESTPDLISQLKRDIAAARKEANTQSSLKEELDTLEREKEAADALAKKHEADAKEVRQTVETLNTRVAAFESEATCHNHNATV